VYLEVTLESITKSEPALGYPLVCPYFGNALDLRHQHKKILTKNSSVFESDKISPWQPNGRVFEKPNAHSGGHLAFFFP
jgi:hypothetical protein